MLLFAKIPLFCFWIWSTSSIPLQLTFPIAHASFGQRSYVRLFLPLWHCSNSPPPLPHHSKRARVVKNEGHSCTEVKPTFLPLVLWKHYILRSNKTQHCPHRRAVKNPHAMYSHLASIKQKCCIAGMGMESRNAWWHARDLISTTCLSHMKYTYQGTSNTNKGVLRAELKEVCVCPAWLDSTCFERGEIKHKTSMHPSWLHSAPGEAINGFRFKARKQTWVPQRIFL